MRIPRNAHEPIPTGFNRDSIYSVAAAASKLWEHKPGQLCAPLWQRLGGKIGHMIGMTDVVIGMMPSDQSDSLIVYGKNDYLAMLQSPHETDRPRTNFDLAIQIGYLTMHFQQVQKQHGADATMVVRHYPKTKAQKDCQLEAMQFAIGLLAPPETLLLEWDRLDGDLNRLRDFFKLPGHVLTDLHEQFSSERAKAA